MKLDKFKVILILILILAAALRLWNLSGFPDGLNADEAALGYNAYSILHTGRDEYGTFLPLTLKSFGDYKPDLYTYLDIPFVALMGLNVWSTRLPSAILGIVSVFLLYILARRIFKSENVGLFSALLLAISPWHLQFSRGAWETNVATFFITLGIYFFIDFVENQKHLFWCLLMFLASMYTYQSPRLIVPVLVLVLLGFYWKEIFVRIPFKQFLKANYLPLIVAIILSIPFVLQNLSPNGSARFSGLSIFSDPGPGLRADQLRGEDGLNSIKSKIFYNTLATYGLSFASHYLDHFTSSFYFINGDSLIRNNVPEMGEFYLVEALFLAVGLLSLIGLKAEHKKILIAWILVAPLASALTYQTPSALRALNMVIPLTIIMGLGFSQVTRIKYSFVRWGVLCLIGIFLTFEFIHYLDSYYVIYPKAQPLSWEYGFDQMVSKLERYQDSYNKVVVTDRYDQPYILVLYFEKYDPGKYQPQAHLSERDKFNFGTVRNFDKYEFHTITKQEVDSSKNTLFIGTPQELSGEPEFDSVDFLNGQEAFVFVSK